VARTTTTPRMATRRTTVTHLRTGRWWLLAAELDTAVLMRLDEQRVFPLPPAHRFNTDKAVVDLGRLSCLR